MLQTGNAVDYEKENRSVMPSDMTRLPKPPKFVRLILDFEEYLGFQESKRGALQIEDKS